MLTMWYSLFLSHCNSQGSRAETKGEIENSDELRKALHRPFSYLTMHILFAHTHNHLCPEKKFREY